MHGFLYCEQNRQLGTVIDEPEEDGADTDMILLQYILAVAPRRNRTEAYYWDR